MLLEQMISLTIFIYLILTFYLRMDYGRRDGFGGFRGGRGGFGGDRGRDDRDR